MLQWQVFVCMWAKPRTSHENKKQNGERQNTSRKYIAASKQKIQKMKPMLDNIPGHGTNVAQPWRGGPQCCATLGKKKDIAVLLNNIGQVASNVAQHWRGCPQCCATLGRIFEIVDFAELIQNSAQKKKNAQHLYSYASSGKKREPKKGKNKRKHPKVRRQCCATLAPPPPNVAQHSGAEPELGICFVFQRQLRGASGHVHRAHGSVVPSEACAVLSGVAAPPPPPPSSRPRTAGPHRQSCASYLAGVSICLAERALASRPQIRRIAGQ